MLSTRFNKKGYSFLHSNHYINESNYHALHDIKKAFDLELAEDTVKTRRRAYLKLQFDTTTKKLSISSNQNYFQTAKSNREDGGKSRQFKKMPMSILENCLIQQLIATNLDFLINNTDLDYQGNITLGMHFIRYVATEDQASTSSPSWLHKDDEPLVFVHLINLTQNALGGDNLIADTQTKSVTKVIRLENSFETLVLNRNVFHAVTPLGSKRGTASRDVILFTVEPSNTQIN